MNFTRKPGLPGLGHESPLRAIERAYQDSVWGSTESSGEFENLLIHTAGMPVSRPAKGCVRSYTREETITMFHIAADTPYEALIAGTLRRLMRPTAAWHDQTPARPEREVGVEMACQALSSHIKAVSEYEDPYAVLDELQSLRAAVERLVVATESRMRVALAQIARPEQLAVLPEPVASRLAVIPHESGPHASVIRSARETLRALATDPALSERIGNAEPRPTTAGRIEVDLVGAAVPVRLVFDIPKLPWPGINVRRITSAADGSILAASHYTVMSLSRDLQGWLKDE